MSLVQDTQETKQETKQRLLSCIDCRLRESGMAHLIPLAHSMAEGPMILDVMMKRCIDAELADKLYHALVEASPEELAAQHPLDRRMLEHCTARAYGYRFASVRKTIQRLIRDQRIPADPIIASIPCGYMRELLTIDYGTSNPHLIGIDIDRHSLDGARRVAKEVGFSRLDLYLKDALALGPIQPVDVISGHGLTQYLDGEEAEELYSQYYGSLRSGGYCITNHMTPPSDWNRSLVSAEEFELQENFFNLILQGLWVPHMCSIPATCERLERVGFDVVEIIKDPWGINPCFVARKN